MRFRRWQRLAKVQQQRGATGTHTGKAADGDSDAAPVMRTFLVQPQRTILLLSVPILLSLIAEPVTGLVDTGFVAQLGKEPLAALGVGSGALSAVFWIFAFLGIATQTQVAQSYGRGKIPAAVQDLTLALVIGVLLSLLLSAALGAGAPLAAAALGAEGAVRELAAEYIQLRLLGAPAVIITIVGFGALRGIQDMKTPLWIALGINITNILLDYPFIFGAGFFPALGVGGAALASSLSQWLGAGAMLWQLRQRLGLARRIRLRDGLQLLAVGRDLFIRTGMLTVFMLLATRTATQIGADAGAAHQVIRQVWFFSALVLEAFASTAQSLVGYFYGSGQLAYARRVARLTTLWSLGTGLLLAAAMLLTTPLVTAAFVPADTVGIFMAAWWAAALSQPLNALAFITDGIHWGSSDYAFLRNVMTAATVCGWAALQLIAVDDPAAFTQVWLATGLWIAVRGLWGILRVYPGIGDSPLRRETKTVPVT